MEQRTPKEKEEELKEREGSQGEKEGAELPREGDSQEKAPEEEGEGAKVDKAVKEPEKEKEPK